MLYFQSDPCESYPNTSLSNLLPPKSSLHQHFLKNPSETTSDPISTQNSPFSVSPMDTILKAKKLQAKKYRRTQFLYNLSFDILVALICFLLCSYPYWFLPLCSSTKQFLFFSLPNTFASFLSPTCLFIVANVIVIFLVGESKLLRSNSSSSSSPSGDIYDEYVERIKSLRGVSSITLHEEAERNKPDLMNLMEESTRAALVEDKEVIKEEEGPEKEEEEEEREVIKEETKEVDELGQINNNEDKNIGKQEGGAKQDGDEEEEMYGGLPTEELNRRVEEFIARVNRQRWLEAQSVVPCKA